MIFLSRSVYLTSEKSRVRMSYAAGWPPEVMSLAAQMVGLRFPLCSLLVRVLPLVCVTRFS